MFKRFFGGQRNRGGEVNNKIDSTAVNAGGGALIDGAQTGELIAVFAAAIAAMSADGGLPFRVVSFRRTSQTAPAWSLAGRQEYISGNF